MMKIVCLGWGSLIWKPGELKCSSEWQADGPALPIEYARVSRDGRITLVIVEGGPTSPVLWSPLVVDSLDDAVKMLAAREHTDDLGRIGRWSPVGKGDYPGLDVIAAWATERRIDGVVWTALPPGLKDSRGTKPALQDLIAHINGLTVEQRGSAAEYVEKTPKQIATAYRSALEGVLELAAQPVSVSFQADIGVPGDQLSNDNNPAESPDAFLDDLARTLPDQEDTDADLARILAVHILKASPAKGAVDAAFAEIAKLAVARAAVRDEGANE
ncbi:hypothetical protein NKH55_21305 [Mesorhizobium opportunistum]|uniref:hypothetical protein n=1 Tax=Mesorhizobium opportunistum TaxID=593909 RepID=UPI00333ACFD5